MTTRTYTPGGTCGCGNPFCICELTRNSETVEQQSC